QSSHPQRARGRVAHLEPAVRARRAGAPRRASGRRTRGVRACSAAVHDPHGLRARGVGPGRSRAAQRRPTTRGGPDHRGRLGPDRGRPQTTQCLADASIARAHPGRAREAARGAAGAREAGPLVSPTFHSLRHRDYRLYWSGMFVSNVGTWMQRVAQDWLVLQVLHGGGQAVGITTGLQFLPFLLVAPFGGLLADKLPKRYLLIFTNAFMGCVGLVLGILVLTGQAEIWHVYVLAFLLGVGTALDNPARQAFVSALVVREDIPNAIALNSASFNAARLIGPAVAGAAIALIGTGWVLGINGLSFASPLIVLLMPGTMVVPESDPEDRRDEPTGALSRLREGVAYVRSRPDLVMVMVIMFGVGTFGMNFQMTMALMATEVYDRGPEEYGLLGSIMAIGT